ncbi:MAG: LL-diaminopimelate aminotransferase, partial [Clostridia bacterium]|nr:LL-diaminopimelate aminotransferase [Clostridia bacterium]
RLVSLGIGDVTLPLPPVVCQAMQKAVAEMGSEEGFRGYSPEGGYPFLKQANIDKYARWGVKLNEEEVYVSDGAKVELGSIYDVLDVRDVLIPCPTYPAYYDDAILAGANVHHVTGDEGCHFLPPPPEKTDTPYLIFLCSPLNPRGVAYDKNGLCEWVNFALKSGSLLVFDCAYEAYITDDRPHSIYEIEGASGCAVEISSFSKSAGFTGVRLGWTVWPKDLKDRHGISLLGLWRRRQSAKSNGVSYISQRAGEAALSQEGEKAVKKQVAYYGENARLLRDVLLRCDITYYGGIHSPYLWVSCKKWGGSWAFFHFLLQNAHIISTPGVGFGEAGEGFVRLSSFGRRQDVIWATEQIERVLRR